MSTGKRNKTEMAPSFQKNRKNQDQKSELLKPGDKAQPTAEQIRIAQIIDTKAEDPALKDKVKQVMEATKRTEDEVITALHDCDNDPDAAVAFILEGGHTEWSTSKKKKSKPPVEKSKDTSSQNANSKTSNNNTISPAGEIDDWNEETENADENLNLNKVNSVRGKGMSSRPFRGGSTRPYSKRGTGRMNAPRDGFNRSAENNSDWSKSSFKPPRGGGRNFFKSRNGPQKDGDSFDNKEISERLGQNDHNVEKHDSGGSDWGSDTSDHNKNMNQNSFHTKSGDMKEDNKWQDDNYWNKSQSRGRGGGMRSRSFNSFNRQSDDGGDTRGGFQNKGGRGRGRFQGSRNRGEGRGGSRWDDGSGFRGRMSNGPSRGGWRGGRGSRSMSNKPPIETWNPEATKEEEDWDQEEEIFTGKETKVFTPSAIVPSVQQSSVLTEPPKLIQDSPLKEERTTLVSEPVPPPASIPTTGQQFLAQLTQNASNVPKSIPQSVFNEVHFNKTEMSTSEYGGNFGLNSYSESESNNDSKQQVPRARLPPPSKIPSSAVEMPPDVGSGIALLDVQFGGLELEQPAEPQVPAAPPSPSPPPPQPEPQVPAPTPQVSSELPVYQRPAIQDLLTKSEPQPSSTYYQDSYQTQYPKTTHQTYSSSYSQPSYNSSQSIYSTGLGSNNSLSNPYQNYSGQVSRHSALTSTTNSKELDMPTPSVNISPPSAKPKVVPVPPGVAAPPALVNPQYIVNQPYIQQPFYSLEDLQILQGGRLPHVPEYYGVSYTNPASSAPREFDNRFPTQDTSTSPAPPNPTPSQNQTLMNPPIPYFAYYGGGNYQYSAPIYPIAAGSSTGNQHQTTNPPYGKTAGNYNAGPSYTSGGGNYENQAAQAGGDYNKGRDPVGVNKVTQGVYQVSQSSATNNLSNIYSKTYDKHSFNCATPPPPPTYTLGSGSSLGGGYSAQGLFYSAVTPHHQPLHQPMDTAQSRTQLGAPPAKPQPKQKYSITPPYWHQQN